MKRFRELDRETKLQLLIGAMSMLCFVAGFRTGNIYVWVPAGGCVLLLVRRWILDWRKTPPPEPEPSPVVVEQPGSEKKKKKKKKKKRKVAEMNPTTSTALMDRMLDQGRSAILLRPEVIKKLNREQTEAALESLDQDMARVSSGKVWLYAPSKVEIENGASAGPAAETSELLVDRCTVTNREYQLFVDNGGYDNDEFWCESSAEVKSQFVDKTGEPGPRYWIDGEYPKGHGNLPVVGISWFEANAYARWVGKRLPTSPEWVKAAVAPTSTVSVASQQRRFPWGESVEASQANLWQTGIGKTVSVTHFAESAVHDIHQMIGNVWEWNQDDFGSWQPEAGWDCNEPPLKSIRGGAYDTYLESQAACLSQSGEEPFARRHNVGFRCVADPNQLVLQE